MIDSDIDICNMALDHLNQQNITSMDEKTKASKKCKQWYDITRKSLLTNLNASFSIARAVLAEVKNVTPVYGYSKAFALPNDCLQVLNLGNPLDNELYQIEGGYLYCNRENSEQAVQIRYIKDIQNVFLFDAEFIELFALALAEAICIPLTEDTERKNMITQLKKEKYICCSAKYGRDNRITVINRSRFRESKIFSEILDADYPLK